MKGHRRQSRSTLRHLSVETTRLSLDAVILNTQTDWSTTSLIPARHQQQMTEDIALITFHAEQLGIRTFGDLMTKNAGLLAATLGKEPGAVTRFLELDERDRDRVRNTIGALMAGAALGQGDDPRTPLTHLPDLNSARGPQGRPLRDDEIVLARHTVTDALRQGGRRVTPALQYVLGEAGAWPLETTTVTPDDLDDPAHATQVALPGVNQRILPRTVRIDDWERNQINCVLDLVLLRHPHALYTPLAYRGEVGAGTTAAGSTASSNLANVMTDSGLTDNNIEPRSIPRWRVLNVLHETGHAAALATSGHKTAAHLATWLGMSHQDFARVRPRTPGTRAA